MSHSKDNESSNEEILRPKQILMCVSGEGGTGKSRIIEAVSALFSSINRRESLMICAPTGSAAVNVGGSIIHSNMAIVPNKRKRDEREAPPTDGSTEEVGEH